jgi:Ran GTPase-activating protein (RanGAP) involved in mRNA processing and transport
VFHVDQLATLICQRHVRLRQLNLSHCQLTEASYPSLARILSCHDLHILDVSYNALRCKGLGLLIPALTHADCTLHTLGMSHTKLGAAGCVSLVSILQHNRSIHTLIVSHNQLGKKGIKTMLPALLQNTTLKHFNVSANGIVNGGASLLAQVLHKPSCSWVRSVSYN